MEKKDNYSELLKDPRWQRRRLEIMQRDDFTCQHCGRKDKTLHIHHKRYVKGWKPWEYKDGDLITLCERCHEIETEYNSDIYREFSELREAFMVTGFSMQTFSSVIGLIHDAVIDWKASEPDNPARKVIEYAVYGTAIISDIFAANEIGIDIREFLEKERPDLLDKLNKE